MFPFLSNSKKKFTFLGAFLRPFYLLFGGQTLYGSDNIKTFHKKTQTDGLVWLLTGDQMYKTILSIPTMKTKDERSFDYKSTQ